MKLKSLLTAAAMVGAASIPLSTTACASAKVATPAPASFTGVLDYVHNQNSTGFLVIQNGKILAEQNWAPPQNPQYSLFVYGRAPDGSLLEDVASQQKSFVSVLIAIAIDKGLIDVTRPVSDYIGAGWSKAAPEQEAKIRVIDVLNMNTGLADDFTFRAPSATLFHYNTPVYAISKRIVVAAAKQPLETITHDWLTAPAGMNNTAWRKRPAQLASIGNDTGLVTTPRDTALFGLMILNKGVSNDGKRVVSEKSLNAMFERSATNPAYGRLWWLNGSEWTARLAGRTEGQLIPGAPADMVAALGAFDRRLYIVPSMKLVIVRTGAAASDKTFDQQLWARLMKVLQ